MNYIGRSISALMAALLLCGTLNACGGGDGKPNFGTSASTSSAAETTTDDGLLHDNLPAKSFGGKEFVILAGSSTFYKGYIDVEDETGDILNDAIFKRNRTVEDRFNFLFKQILMPATEANNTGYKTILAGDHAYDLISFTDRDALNHAIEGLLMRYDEMPFIDLDQPYWCQNINDNISIGNKNYLAYSDFNLSVYDYTFNIAFNKELLGTLNLESPYKLVGSGKWTFDKFYEMGATAYSDINGDGKKDANDRYGWFAISKQISPSLWVAAGQAPIKKDKNDLPYFAMSGDVKFAEVFSKILKMTWGGTSWYQTTVDVNPNTIPMFSSGNALFITTSFGVLDTDYYRSMTQDYGILPNPKYDEKQENYYTRVEGGRIFTIPLTTTDTDFTGVVLEALSCESANTVIPIYFEVALKTKYTRDNESAQMFDLIMNSRVYDLGDTFWCTQIRDGFIRTLFNTNSDTLASAIETNKPAIETKINEAIDAYLKLK